MSYPQPSTVSLSPSLTHTHTYTRRRIPLFQTRSCEWRALSGGAPVSPSTAFSYVSRALRQTTPFVLGSLRLLAASYVPQELNERGYSLYADFRPAVDGWGKRGEVRCAQILSLRKQGTQEPPPARAGGVAVVAGSSETPSKKAKIVEHDPTL